MAQQSQAEPVSPMKSRRFRTYERSQGVNKSRAKPGFLGRPFSLVPGCSRHAGPQKDRSEPRCGPPAGGALCHEPASLNKELAFVSSPTQS
jgi:hypothetical protein